HDEPALFINQGEPEGEVRANAVSVGLDLGDIQFLDLTPSATLFAEAQQYDVFHPAEVDLEPTTQAIVETVDRVKPVRVFLDAMTQLRYMSLDHVHFRTQAFSLLRYLVGTGATVLFASESQSSERDEDLQFLSDGVIHMGNQAGVRSVMV